MKTSSLLHQLVACFIAYQKVYRLGVFSLVILPTAALAQITDLKPFDWSMPDRLLCPTCSPGNADGMPVYAPNASMVPSGGWRVDFNACNITSANLVRYQWSVDGQPVGEATACKDASGFAYKFPQEGSYKVTLTVTDDIGDTASEEQDVIVQDWLIVALGDSYGSGEGNPDIPVQAVQYNVLDELSNIANQISNDVQASLDKLPNLADAQDAAQQFMDDAQKTRDQTKADLDKLRADLQNLITIQINVENKPAVIAARNNLTAAIQRVSQRQHELSIAQNNYNNCRGVINCGGALARLTEARAALATANTRVKTATATLNSARDTAVVFYSIIGTIQNFPALQLAIDAKNFSVNLTQNALNTAQDALNNATAALQKTIDAVASLQSVINDLRNAEAQAIWNYVQARLDHLPVWTKSAPSWGTPEPTYSQIMLQGAVPGEALRCHRSMNSGQARAALALERADPHTSVTLLHLSCSGATIPGGLVNEETGPSVDSVFSSEYLTKLKRLGKYYFTIPQHPTAGQLPTAAARVLGREVDAMVISVGGNDLGFAGIIQDCIFWQPCDRKLNIPPSSQDTNQILTALGDNCHPIALINDRFGLSLPLLARLPFSKNCDAYYNQLISDYNTAATAINDQSGGALKKYNANLPVLDDNFIKLNNELLTDFPNLDTRRVYLTEYPNPTEDDNGNYCYWSPGQSANDINMLPGVTYEETTWADQVVATGLREHTQTAAAMYGWNFISDTGIPGKTIGSETIRHGYCANDHYFIRIPETLLTQHDPSGVMHPNKKGHSVYQQAIFHQLVADMYPNGLTASPRAPNPNETTPPPPLSFSDER